jgi:hydrogenase maturation protein HypF
MAGFTMCPECQREYDTVEDRRFHAQPNACPTCGPRLRALAPNGEELASIDPITAAAQALVGGLIVAVKGIGGFHLACDATSSSAVTRLRERKRREEKPFAVMVADLAAALQLADLSSEERRLLVSVERPIVLARRREPSALAPEVGPDNPLIGLILAYAPLHILLLGAAGTPLVMTSGNLSEEPIARTDAEALERLRGIADLFLVHDREIVTRCDDSVARIIAGRPVVFRRSRGYVPRPVPVARPFVRPVLAVGGHLKNTFCFGVGDAAFFGPHVGDLDNLETYDSFVEAVERMQRFLGVDPEVVAHDLHPEYLSTRYALTRHGAEHVAVQHHHAHVASAMAEHRLEGPVLGVAYDGTGYGTDGTAWGGEILLARATSFERVATLRPIRLAGGDTAIRDVWRITLALLDDAFGGDPPLDALALFRDIPRKRIAGVRQMIERGVNAPAAHGLGRYFDGIGALVLGRGVARYEGQIALKWNLVANATEAGRYPFELVEAPLAVLDLRPLVRAVVGDVLAGAEPGAISARFHNTIVAATAAMVHLAARRAGRVPVVLTGGCFQNALLAERVRAALVPEFDVYLHGEVPPGDGGLALGQAVVADATASANAGD